MSTKQEISVFWFRRDLRFFDNIGLQQALDSGFPVLPIFIFDPQILRDLPKKDARVQFILDSVLNLKHTLEGHDSSLQIFYDSPIKVFKKLVNTHKIKHVFANRDYEPYAISRDKTIEKLLKDQNIQLHLFKDQVIFEGPEVLKSDGTPYKVFTPFKKVWLQRLDELEYYQNQDQILFDKFFLSKPFHDLTLNEMGFSPSDVDIPPEEIKLKVIKEYDQKRDFPELDGTSRLGIHFRFGTISIREKVQKARKYNFTFLNELIWREFYSYILQHFPHVAKSAFNKKYDLIPWKNDEKEFKKWCEGKTGFPIVDAGMRQLNQTGYMHNRVRMITASFLTKHLLIDWRWGESYFAEKLLDFELASNNGGWQWAAGSGTDAQPYFRVFNPERQMQKFDPNLAYIKKWIPEYDTSSYPAPIVDHKFARERAIRTYKSAVSN